MKKILSLLTVVMVALQLSAAPVSPAAAQVKAQQYLNKTLYAGKYMAPAATQPQLVMTEMGDINKNTPVFYVFNTSTTYLIVSGDDRAEEILAYGDKPLNLNRIPDGLRDIMNIYKKQLDWLLSNPDVQVDKPTTYKSPKIRANETYGPLLTALWDQDAPYWNQCKFTYSGSTYQCLTGCPATSASMVMYYWKWPTYEVDAIPSYTATLDLSYYNSVNYTYPALSAVTFDWDNMKDSYSGSYTSDQGTAVATLMRYVGQAEHMMNGTESAGGSGIYTSDSQTVVDMFVLFGYDEETCQVVHKSSYSEANWAELVQNEMAEGRPVVYMAVSGGWYGGGHAFNVDGYNSSTNKYHVNFGWSGDGNNWYSMNAFSYSGSTYSQDQQMVIGIQPSVMSPKIKVSEKSLSMTSKGAETSTATFTVTGMNLVDDITVTLNDENGLFSVDPATISMDAAAEGYTVTVSYNPQTTTATTASLILSSTDATDVTVSLTGKATKSSIPAPVLDDPSNITSNSFTASWTLNSTADVTFNLSVSTNTGNVVANIADIVENSYNVTNLTPGTSYIFAVKAVPVNANLYNVAGWSNRKNVTLLSESTFELGDVNNDGSIDVDDVNLIINVILTGGDATSYEGRADLNGDGVIDIDDVNAVISLILTGN